MPIYTDPRTRKEWQKIVDAWEGCKACPLHTSRRKIVHYRGHLPCDVLFIGEAPGDSEDAMGEPFVGPAGELLDKLLGRTICDTLDWEPSANSLPLSWCNPQEDRHYTVGITNIVACRPKTSKTEFDSGTIREPTKQEALSCQPRLLETIKLANPGLIVLLGKIAVKNAPAELLGNIVELTRLHHVVQLPHPAAILRADSRRDLMEKRWVLSMADALKELQ